MLGTLHRPSVRRRSIHGMRERVEVLYGVVHMVWKVNRVRSAAWAGYE